MSDRPDIAPGTVAKAIDQALAGPKLSNTIRFARDIPTPPPSGATLLDEIDLRDKPPVNKSGTVGEAVVNDISHGVGQITDPLFAPATTHTKWSYSGHGIFRDTLLDKQEKFAKNHAGDLKNLGGNVREVRDGLRHLAAVANKGVDYTGGSEALNKLLLDKRAMGDKLMERIDDRLGDADTDEERAKLEALKKDLTDFQAERDKRIAAEMPEWRGAVGLLAKTNREAGIQGRRFEKALDAANEIRGGYGHTPTTDNAGYTRPQTAAFMAGMQEFLIGGRAELDDQMTQARDAK